MTGSTPARLYQLRSKMTTSPAAGKCGMYRCTYICDFSRSVGAGSATTRNTRGLTRSVIRLIVPPLPAVSRPSNTMQILAPVAFTHSCIATSSPWSLRISASYSLRFIFGCSAPAASAGGRSADRSASVEPSRDTSDFADFFDFLLFLPISPGLLADRDHALSQTMPLPRQPRRVDGPASSRVDARPVPGSATGPRRAEASSRRPSVSRRVTEGDDEYRPHRPVHHLVAD